MKILAIESSCDETAVAIVEGGVKELASAMASSAKLHEKTGGVVPEVAARKQLDFIVPVLAEVQSHLSSIDALAVTVGPGLVGSLIVGVEAAKSLALTLDKPLIPVNHLVGHIYANFLDKDPAFLEFPAMVLVVSGGHTDLVLMKTHGDFEYLGGTIDDAAGEAFDKTARILGISNYLGGALLSKEAAKCEINTLKGKLPRPLINDSNYDFSFSGLKTAVKRLFAQEQPPIQPIACEFEDAVCDVLVTKTVKAAKEFKVKSVLLGGGVSANKKLRARLQREISPLKVPLYIPPIRLCGDNAVYIASAAFFNQKIKPLAEIKPNPSLSIMDTV
jgi:N6-L-threonylcarbamoyladenine synthase